MYYECTTLRSTCEPRPELNFWPATGASPPSWSSPCCYSKAAIAGTTRAAVHVTWLYAAGAGEKTRSSFGFTVDDLDAVHRQVEAAGTKVVQPPTTRPWGRSATYQDADGNTVSLTQA